MTTGYTKKKCHGCGVVTSLPPNCVCGSCSTAIREYPEAKARLASSDKDSLQHFYLGIRTSYPALLGRLNCLPKFTKAMCDLLKLVGHAQPNPKPFDKRPDAHIQPEPPHMTLHEVEYGDRGANDFEVYLPQGIREVMHDLYIAIGEIAQESEARGHQKGRNLLMQLNANKLSVHDFNEAAIRNDSRIDGVNS